MSKSEKDCIILDACCIINLFASGKMKEIINSFPQKAFVSREVVEEEALHVYDKLAYEADRAKLEIDLSPLIGEKTIILLNLTTIEEQNAFVTLSQFLDDGEARSGALAFSHNCILATDDRKAIKILSNDPYNLRIINTPEIIQHWENQKNISPAELKEVLQNIRDRGNYFPSPSVWTLDKRIQAQPKLG